MQIRCKVTELSSKCNKPLILILIKDMLYVRDMYHNAKIFVHIFRAQLKASVAALFPN